MNRFTRITAILDINGEKLVHRRDCGANIDDLDDSRSIHEEANDMPLIDFGDEITGSYNIFMHSHSK